MRNDSAVSIEIPDFDLYYGRKVLEAHRRAGAKALRWFVENRLKLRFSDSEQMKNLLGWKDRSERMLELRRKARARGWFKRKPFFGDHNWSGSGAHGNSWSKRRRAS